MIRLWWKFLKQEELVPHNLYMDRYTGVIDLYEYLRPDFSLKSDDNPGELGPCVLIDEGDKISFSIHIVSLVLRKLASFQVDYSCISEYYGSPLEFDLSNQDYLRDDQYEFMKIILSKYSGLIQLPTGYGKNTMITYMINKYLGSGNILIMAPISSVLSEIKVRCEAYGIEVSEDFDKRVSMMNPIGFLNSNKKDLFRVKEWLDDVSLIIIDESENINESLRVVLEDYCYNHKYIYGTSASAEKYNGTDLTNLTRFNKLSYATYSLIHYIGLGAVYKKSDKGMIISVAETKFPKEPYNPYWNQEKVFNCAMKAAIESDLPTRYIKYILPYTDGVLLVPVKSGKQGRLIYDNLVKEGIISCYWDAGTIDTNAIITTPLTDPSTLPPPKLKKDGTPRKVQTGQLDPTKINNTEELKVAINTNIIKVLIGLPVSYKGFDAKNISDVMMMVGSQYNTVAQIAGRAERYTTNTGKEFTVWLLKPSNESDCPINLACHYSRVKHLKNSHIHVLNNNDFK
jgi:hypothetical protein